MAFPADILGLTVEIALGADLTADQSTWTWTDVTDYVEPRAQVVGVGRADEQSTQTPSKLVLTVNNRDSRWTRLNPSSPWFGLLRKGTPIRVDATDGAITPSRRFFGYIAELPPRVEPGYTDAWVPVTAAGVLRRYDQQDLTDSAARRFVLSQPNLRAYWPLEDESGNGNLAASAVTGEEPLKVLTNQSAGDATGASWASQSDLAGSLPLPAFPVAARLNGTINDRGTPSWSMMFWAKGELDSDSSDGDWVNVAFKGGNVDYRIIGTNTSVICTGTNATTGATIFTLNTADELGALSLIGSWHSIALVHRLSGFTSTLGLLLDGRSGDAATGGFNITRIERIMMPNFHDPTDIQTMALGHLAFFNDGDWTRPQRFHAAGLGYVAETADARITRLCAEEHVPCTVQGGTVLGGIPSSSRMGPQRPGSFGAALRECEKADGGLLYEDPATGGIGYITRARLYEDSAIGATPVMALDIGTPEDPKDLTSDFEPIDGDQYAGNDLTVTRTSGSSARVQRIPAGELADPRSTTINVATDGTLAHQASWRLHLEEVDEYRFPILVLDLASRPERIAAWVLCGIGSRITIDNPPPGIPGPLNLIIVGYDERLDGVEWKVLLNCAPASPYQVAQLPGTLTTVREGFEDDTFAVTITNGGNAAWSRSDDDAHTGTWSFKSGAITNSQTSDAIVTVPAGCTRVRFWYRTSSESGMDLFQLVYASAVRVEASGLTTWTQSPYIGVGPGQTITFRYIKDSSQARFDDAVYIDDIEFDGETEGTTPDERARVDTAGSELVSSVSSSDTVLSVATTRGPIWVNDIAGLALSGASGAYASTPHHAAYNTTDLDVRVWASTPDWRTTQRALMARSTSGNISFRLVVDPEGDPRLIWTTDGSTLIQQQSGTPLPILSGPIAFGATLDVNDGTGNRVVTFYRAKTIDDPWPWTIHSQHTTAGTTSLFAGTSPLELGSISGGTSSRFDGTIYAAQIRSSINGTVQANPRPNSLAPGTTSWADSIGRTWTVNGTASIASSETIDLDINGETVRAVSISGAASPQQFRVVRAVNGVSKSHAAGETVRLASPMILALGD